MVWEECVSRLRQELSAQDFTTWIRPLQVRRNGTNLRILAPNTYVLEHVNENFLGRIRELADLYGEVSDVELGVGSHPSAPKKPKRAERRRGEGKRRPNRLNEDFTFDAFVEGRCNEMGRAAALQVANDPGKSFSPLALYGSTGLGKTHLMQAIGNEVLRRQPRARVWYIHSQQFVKDFVNALREKAMPKFEQRYRKIDVLLIDDVQFFAKTEQSQDEFFNVFNSLEQNGHQLVLTCDRYPKEVKGLEERLKSRFVSGLSVELDVPDLETSAAILLKKAEAEGIDLGEEVAVYLAGRIRSNVRELAGALQRIKANVQFSGAPVTKALVRESLADVFASHHRQVSIEKIQSVVADYYHLRKADLLGPRRSRSVARPRQMAMALAKDLTTSSLPEIGRAFGGRDHTTVLHAAKRIGELCASGPDLAEDYRNLKRQLTR